MQDREVYLQGFGFSFLPKTAKILTIMIGVIVFQFWQQF